MTAGSPTLRAAPLAGAGGWTPSATPVLFYLSVGLIAGAIIALQIAVMRIFSIASWAHFGSLVISIAMLGFGIASAVMCVGKARIERNQDLLAKICLLAFGPLLAAANGLAQMVPFNPIFLVSDPQQKLRLLANFLLYFSPFLPGAVFLGLAFLRGQKAFGRVYFADLLGSGLGGLAFLGALYLLPPERLLLVPLGLWFISGLFWFRMQRDRGGLVLLLLAGALGILLNFALPQIESSPYKGVSYARHFPDAERIYEAASPFGDLEIYHSSYFHFAPGLSDMAAINLPSMPTDAFLGMFIDGDGPIEIIKALPDDQTAYFRFLPMYLPYVVKKGSLGLHRAVRRRHLHQPGAAQRRILGHRRRGQSPCAPGHAQSEDRGADRPYAGKSAHPPGALRRAALCTPGARQLRYRRSQPRRFHRPLQRRRQHDLRELRLYPRGHGELYARPQARRHSRGHDLEQGGSAEIGDPPLHHHDRGRATGR